MDIKSIHIKNYKSLVDFELRSPKAFSVFVGPNAAGKSNIFESLEFLALCNIMNPLDAYKSFGKISDLINKKIMVNHTGIAFKIDLIETHPYFQLNVAKKNGEEYLFSSFGSNDFGIYDFDDSEQAPKVKNYFSNIVENPSYKHFFNFSRIFVGKSNLVKRTILDDTKLSIDCSNLEKVLKRLLKDENKKAEIIEWLQLLIPGFDKIEIINEPLSGSDNLLIYEKGTNKPFNKNLISDGTFNILSILTAVYQSDEPQFLCIEEPENGLNPKVIKELVNLFRQKCNEGHFIWLNTHSQTLVSELTTEEIILVDKVNGETIVKQVKGMNLHGLRMDEALLTNALGGGIPW
ncbi:MAG: AAA family ATPase [Bacteroidota bacterium]|nr:AAA family ATPase [Bacteroidota bacterium]